MPDDAVSKEHLPRIHQRDWRSVTSDARLSGDVQRFHAYPTQRSQTVAHHCWNVARILLGLWPDAPRSLLVEALFHDSGELAVGDTPGHAKRMHPKLAAAIDVVETDARVRQCIPWGTPKIQLLNETERRILKLCDTWECWEEALYERMMGNQFAAYVIAHCQQDLEDGIDKIEDEAIHSRAEELYMRRMREWSL